MLLITTSILEREVGLARWAHNNGFDHHGGPFDDFRIPTFATRSSLSPRQRRIRRRLERQQREDVEDMQQGVINMLTMNAMMQNQRAPAADDVAPRVGRKRVQSERHDPTECDWYVFYVGSDQCKDPTSAWGKKFRRRFRVPWDTYRSMVQEALDKKWFPQHAPGI